jgi:IS30 family transposase
MSHHHITTDDRREIATLLLAGHSHSDIAKYLGKHQTSISREISTNKRADGSYRAGYADKKAKERRLIANQRFRKLGIVQDVTQLVVNKLELYWSPEQIAGRMKHEELPFSISHTAIYQYVYQKRPDLVKYLRFHHNRYRRRYGTKQQEAARAVESNKRSI